MHTKFDVYIFIEHVQNVHLIFLDKFEQFEQKFHVLNLHKLNMMSKFCKNPVQIAVLL